MIPDSKKTHALYGRLPWQPSLPLALLVRGPQGQIVAKQLHDERGILVGIFSHIVKLRNSIFESSAGHLACFVRLTQHLVLEYRIVQREAEANRMCDRQILARDCRRLLIGLSRIL